MRKFSLLLGTVGSTAAWYILSNKKLRTELGKAKNADQTMKILSKYLGGDAQKIGNAVYEWTQSDEFRETLGRAEGVMEQSVSSAKNRLKGLVEGAKKMRENFKVKEGEELEQ